MQFFFCCTIFFRSGRFYYKSANSCHTSIVFSLNLNHPYRRSFFFCHFFHVKRLRQIYMWLLCIVDIFGHACIRNLRSLCSEMIMYFLSLPLTKKKKFHKRVRLFLEVILYFLSLVTFRIHVEYTCYYLTSVTCIPLFLLLLLIFAFLYSIVADLFSFS